MDVGKPIREYESAPPVPPDGLPEPQRVGTPEPDPARENRPEREKVNA